jgi:hypothetical protein
MQLPTIQHLQAIGLAVLESCHVRYDGYGRKRWRLAYFEEGQREYVRGPKCEKTPGYPDGLPGLPLEFDTPTEAMAFLKGCVEKLKRAKAT